MLRRALRSTVGRGWATADEQRKADAAARKQAAKERAEDRKILTDIRWELQEQRKYLETFRHYIATYGQDKVMFGTDFPVIDPVRARREIDDLSFPEPVQAKFFRENASRVFRLGAAGGHGG